MRKVVHIKSRRPYDVRIDRATKWGNRYTHRKDIAARRQDTTYVEGGREAAIEAYRQDLWRRIKAGEVTLDELANLHGKTLACWCAPRPCHGDVLVRAAAWAYAQLAQRDADEAEHNL